MIVVADSGPLHYLILLEHVELLHKFYGEVVVPESVADELSAGGAPSQVSRWMSQPPTWLRTLSVSAADLATIEEELDEGERAAIALAVTMRADLLLIDEAAGRAEAGRLGLRFTGTLGVLRAAADEGMLDVKDVLARLRSTNFYVDDTLLTTIFRKWLDT